jgi:hemoglobin-like flavoprotein
MTRDQIRLVQESLGLVLPLREQAAELFYDRLFQLDPSTRALFAATDMVAQRGKLMAAIAMVVKGLDAPEALLNQVRALGRRHVIYGVEERHYEPVGAALLSTLAAGLGEAFTPELRTAWTAAYKLVSDTMIQAARQVTIHQAA